MKKKKTPGPYKSRFEERVADFLTKNQIQFEYEEAKYSYALKVHGGFCTKCLSKEVASNRLYLPDFTIYPRGKLVLEGRWLLETKGKWTSRDRTKIVSFLRDNPKIKFRILFMRDNKISKNSTTRYSDFCRKAGIEYAISEKGELPKSWLKKRGL